MPVFPLTMITRNENDDFLLIPLSKVSSSHGHKTFVNPIVAPFLTCLCTQKDTTAVRRREKKRSMISKKTKKSREKTK